MLDNQLILIPFIIISFIVFFSALWSFISFISSRLWGWYEVSKHYTGEIPDREINDQFSWRSGRFGWGGYSSVLTFTVSDYDLGISVLFLYRVGHPPLKIPWNEISAVEKRVIFPEVHMSFDKVPNRTLKISRMLAEKIEEASKGNWSFERFE